MFEFIRTSQNHSILFRSERGCSSSSISWLGHGTVTETFANGILRGDRLIAYAPEGLNSLMLGNAMMLSSFQGVRWICRSMKMLMKQNCRN